MRKKFQLSIAAQALLTKTASGSREEFVSGFPEATVTAETAKTPDSQGTIVFTFTGNKVRFGATAESITVDWGDGPEEMPDNLDGTEVRHTYAGEAEHTVRIQAENLSFFNCNEQCLTALDVSNCIALRVLYCSSNKLSALDMSKNTALKGLACDKNQLSADALNRIFTDLPDEYGVILIEDNPGSDTCNRKIAAEKKWEFLLANCYQ
ncbi:MAG: hypothetical protein LBH72_05635 [Proteiniphilum sp.]|jgi:hypothetical protein|nr:hypothetical protein [Proteiniphilum sp.]